MNGGEGHLGRRMGSEGKASDGMAQFDFAGKGKVAVVKTRPGTVLGDVGQVMQLAGYEEALSKELDTVLKINSASRTWYPACSTTPWQLEGVVRRLKADDYRRLIGAQAAAPHVDPYVAEKNNKQKYVVDKYGVENVHLDEAEVEWAIYEPKADMLVLHDLFPEGIAIPSMLIGKNLIELPTLGADSFSPVGGAMASAARSLLRGRLPRSRRVTDEALVDLLTIEREIHPGLFAVMDGTLIGGCPGSRAAGVDEADLLLASADLVALDAVGARLQGINPMSLDFIRLAHEKGIGAGDLRDIEIVGYDLAAQEWGEARSGITVDSGSHDDSPAAAVSAAVARLFDSAVLAPTAGRRRVRQALDTPWGQLFRSYDDGRVALPGPGKRLIAVAAAGLVSLLAAIFVAGRNSGERR